MPTCLARRARTDLRRTESPLDRLTLEVVPPGRTGRTTSAGLEVAHVFRRHGEAYRREHDGCLCRIEARVMSAIELCRTALLGGHTEACADCGLVRYAYNSCRNRHCPTCQGRAQAEWLGARLDASNFTYAEASWTQALADWIGAHTRAFEAIGGVPKIFTNQ